MSTLKLEMYNQKYLTYDNSVIKFNLTNTGISVDEEEYMLFRMDREKMVGENLRDGNMEVAFELWIERINSQQTPTEISTVIKESDIGTIIMIYWFPYCMRAEFYSEFRWYHGHVSSP